MGKVRGRLALDLALGIMLIFEMFYMLTGNTLHEIVGVVFFVTIAVHLLLSRKWMRATRKAFKEHKAFSIANALRVGLAILLCLIMVLLGVSSVLTSNVLLLATGVDLAGEAYGFWASVHTVAAYALCACVLAHVAVHWVSVVKALRLPYDPGRRQAINAGVSSAAVVGMVALGFAGAKALGDPVAALTGESVLGDEVPGAPGAGASADKASPRIDYGQDDAATGGKGSGADRYGGGGDRYARTPDGSGGNGAGDRRGNGSADSDGNAYGNGRGGGNATDGTEGSRGYGNGNGNGSQGDSSRGNGGSGSSGGGSGSAPNSGNGNSGGSSGGSGGSGGNGATGICNLCRKRCPLSAPQCRKPYDAGLI